MQYHHSGSTGPVKISPTSGPENDVSQKKASMIANLFYLIMIISITASLLAMFWFTIKLGQ